MLVAGQYRVPEEGEAVPYAGASPLTGETGVSYGGLEFLLSDDSRNSADNALYLLDTAGNRYTGFPEYMVVEGEGLRFYLTGGIELFFNVAGDGSDLRITGNFNDETFTGLELPYRPLKSSRVRDNGTGQFLIISDGRTYRFNRSDAEGRQVLVLQKGGPAISYGVTGDEREFHPDDYIFEEARDAGAYRETLAQWVDRNYAFWVQAISAQNDEDPVIAYEVEALQRGAFPAALSAVSRNFLSGSRRSYESSVYLGGMTAAHRGFVTAEEEKLTRITRGINEKSPDFLLERHVFEFLAIRSQGDLLNRGITLIRSLDPASLTLEQIPGLLEALTDLRRPQVFRASGSPEPIIAIAEPLTAQALAVLSRQIRHSVPLEERPAGMILVFVEGENRADTEWNIRLGKALEDWGEAANQEVWAAIGRSLVLSVLSMTNGEGQVIAAVQLGDQKQGGTGGPAGESRDYVTTGRLYRLLDMGDYRPRALAFTQAPAGLWAWTASPNVSVSREGQVLDLAISFPSGGSHYMLIRGVQPFYRLQFYGMDWRTDPQFERYDSSGWVYYAQNQILVLKIKHRATVEHVRLYLGSPPPPPPPPAAAPAEGAVTTESAAGTGTASIVE
jgi:hypothetical protein